MSGPRGIGRVALRGLRAHTLRLALTTFAVVLGVCFVAGTMVFRDTTARSVDGLFGDLFDQVQVIVRAEQAYAATDDAFTEPIPQDVVDDLVAALPAAVVEPQIEGYAAIVRPDGGLVGDGWQARLGGQWVDDPDSPIQVIDGEQPRAPDEVVIDADSAAAAGLRPGDRVQIVTANGTRDVRMSGVFTFGSLSGLAGLTTYVAFPPEVASAALLDDGQVSSVIVYADDGTSADALRARVEAVLPAGLEAVTGREEADAVQRQMEELLDLMQVLLLGFAGVSVFVGSFLVFNTFTMLVAQRTRELALLRAIGASRGQVTRLVLAEATGVGVLGSTLGLLAGLGVAALLRALTSTAGIRLPSVTLVVTWQTALVAYLVGTVVTVAAAFVPARRAATVPPVAALRDEQAMPPRTRRVRVVAGTLVAALGAVLAATGAGDTGAVGLAMAVVLVAALLLGPALTRPVAGVLGAPFALLGRTVGRLARENARRNPRRTAATAAALMIGAALVGMAVVLAESTRASTDRAYENDLAAPFVLQAATPTGFGDAAVDAAAAVPGVRGVTPASYGMLDVGGTVQPMLVVESTAALATALDLRPAGSGGAGDPAGPGGPDGQGGPGGPDGSAGPGGADPGGAGATELAVGEGELLVQRSTADAAGWAVGDPVDVTYPDGAAATLRIAAVVEDSPLLPRPFVLTRDTYQPHAPELLHALAYVEAEPSARAALDAALRAHPDVLVEDRSQAAARARGSVDQVLAVVVGLLALSVLVAALGIVNTLALSLVERTRELGLLRAVGMSRRHVRRMVRQESIIVAAFGAALGLAIGAGFGVLLQRAMADQGVAVLSVPWGQLALLAAGAVVIGVLAALWPAARAARTDVLRAITTQ